MKQTIKTISIIALLVGSLNVFAFDNKSDAGAVVGGIVGGVIGNQIGGGSGNTIATGIGVIIGAAVGSSIGASLDRMDQMALQDAQNYALSGPVGRPYEWDGARYGSRTGAYGSFSATRAGYHRHNRSQVCRSYRSEIRRAGRVEVRTGTTCRGNDGRWYEVRSSDVVFSNY